MIDLDKMGRFLQQKRREKGMTQQQVADRLHLTFQAVSKWEQGATSPAVELLPEIAQLYEVTVDELLMGSEKPASR